jgi:glycosyltransferase involved in cell wall biosynthesis
MPHQNSPHKSTRIGSLKSEEEKRGNHMNLNTQNVSPTFCADRTVKLDQPDTQDGAYNRVQQLLFLPCHPARKGEGGLRTKGHFKKSLPNKPLISVVTVVFNGEKHLEETILSVVNQGYDNVEFIIIDGGSIDGTLDIVKKYQDRIDYWVSEPDRGISDAFNKGISLSTGIMIGLINSDDWYEPDTIELIAPMANADKVDIVHGLLQYWRDGKKGELVSGDERLLDKDMTVNHMTVFAKRSLYETIGLFSQEFRYAMDYELLLRAKKAGASFYYLDRCLANMRLGGVSDIRWQGALLEVARAKALHSNNSYNPKIYYVYQLTKSCMRRILERLGLVCVVRYYHAKFSLVRKIADRN